MITRARVLLVDQFAPWRDYLRARLQGYSHCEMVGESADGLDGVKKAQELQPDIIRLDIALPYLNGIEVARKIRTVAPRSKILFLSVEDSSDLVEAAMKSRRTWLPREDRCGIQAVGNIRRPACQIATPFLSALPDAVPKQNLQV